MKIPEGVSFHGWGYRLGPGDEVPDEVLAMLPDDHPLKQSTAAAKVEPARPTRDRG